MTGTLRWRRRLAGQRAVWVSVQAARMLKPPNEGDEVEFTVTQGPKGSQAQAVKKLTPAAR